MASIRTLILSAPIMGMLVAPGFEGPADPWRQMAPGQHAAPDPSPPEQPAIESPGADPGGVDESDRAAPDAAIRLDVLVLDEGGRPIRDLRPEEFEITVAGASVPRQAVRIARLDGPQPGDDERETAAGRAPDGGAAVPGARVFGLFLDEYHVAPEHTDRVRAALERFVGEEIRSGDRVVVMKPLDDLASLRATTGGDAARAAIGTFEGLDGRPAPRTPLEQELMGRAPAEIEASRAQVVVSGLRALVTYMGRLQAGRKAVVLVSEGFSRPAARGAERLPDVSTVVRTANRAGVAIYAVTLGDGSRPPPFPERPDDPGSARVSTLRTLSEETTGLVLTLPIGPATDLGRIGVDLTGYYRLAFEAVGQADGGFRAVEVRVTRRGARVRAPTGYWARVRPISISTRARSALPRVSLARTTPLTRRPQRRSPLIQATFGMVRGEDGRTRVRFSWVPVRPRNPARDASDAAVLDLTVRTPDERPIYDGSIAPARLDGVEGAFPVQGEFEAPAGLLAIDMTIKATGDRVLDRDVRTIDVPDLRGPRVVIAPIEVLRTSSALDFRRLKDEPAVPPTASREFVRTERLLVRVPAYGPGEAIPSVTARLLNRGGQAMRALDEQPAALGPGVTQFDLPLAWLAPGEYRIEVSAQSGSRQVSEIVSIRVVD